MALLPGSPAIDGADPHCGQNADERVDQRGVSRPPGPRCDIGAFEVEQTSSPTAPPSRPVTGVVAMENAPRPGGRRRLMALVIVALGPVVTRKRLRG
jgi:hypothetical protein